MSLSFVQTASRLSAEECRWPHSKVSLENIWSEGIKTDYTLPYQSHPSPKKSLAENTCPITHAYLLVCAPLCSKKKMKRLGTWLSQVLAL